MADTQVAEAKSTAVANIMDDLFDSAGQGMESIGVEDMQIPFLRLLQPLSPQLLKTDAKYIKGASAGDIFNTVTGQFWEADAGLTVLVCAYTTKFLEFQLREAGGGFMGELEAGHPDIRKTERVGANEMLPSGNELVRVAQFLVLGVDKDTKMAGLKIMPPEKGLFTPPMWAVPWKLTTVQESNDKGSWFNFAVNKMELGDVPVAAQKEAQQMYDSFKAGDIKTGTGEKQQTAEESDVPF